MREIALGNRTDLDAAVPGVFTAAAVGELDALTQTLLARHGPLLDRRRADSDVRHCHGDLHLANIVLLGDRPVLFDCIEFDDDFACIDVLYDLAFLLMDLIAKGHRPAAARLLNGWLERTADHAGLALLPMFLSLRAAIRAKVLGLAATSDPAADRTEPRRYLDLAMAFLAPASPILLAIGGGSGTGKTTLARYMAPFLPGPAPGAVILRSDVIRKTMLGRATTDRLPPEAYTREVSARVFATIAEPRRHLPRRRPFGDRGRRLRPPRPARRHRSRSRCPARPLPRHLAGGSARHRRRPRHPPHRRRLRRGRRHRPPPGRDHRPRHRHLAPHRRRPPG